MTIAIVVVVMVIFFSLLASWLWKSIHIIGPDEMGVRVRLGTVEKIQKKDKLIKPDDEKFIINTTNEVFEKIFKLDEDDNEMKVNGVKQFEKGGPVYEPLTQGFYFACWPITKMRIYTKNILEICDTTTSIVTKKGMVKEEKYIFESTEIHIAWTVFCFFDPNKIMTETIVKAPGDTAEDIGPILVDYVNDLVRSMGGRIPWKLTNHNRREFSQNILARMTNIKEGCPFIIPRVKTSNKTYEYQFGKKSKNGKMENDCLGKDMRLENSPFVQFGLKDIIFTIQDINFVDEEMRKAISAPEKARIQALASMEKAKGEKFVTIQKGEGAADATEKLGTAEANVITIKGSARAGARKEMIDTIKDNKDLETLATLAKMAEGQSNTMFQIPSMFEGKLNSLIGGNKIGDLINKLDPKDRENVESLLKEYIKKSGKGGSN